MVSETRFGGDMITPTELIQPRCHSNATGICNLVVPWEKRRKRGVGEPQHSLPQHELLQDWFGWNTLDGMVVVRESC